MPVTKHVGGEHHALADFLIHICNHMLSQELVRKSKLGKEEYVTDLYSLENMYYCKKQAWACNLSSKKKHFSCVRTVT